MQNPSRHSISPFVLFLCILVSIAFTEIPKQEHISKQELMTAAALYTKNVSVCSFQIHCLGESKKRHNDQLVKLIGKYDIVLIQGLIAPPKDGKYPDGSSYEADPEVKLFFHLMKTRGYDYLLSEEDTGPGRKNHKNSCATEWSVAFYKKNAVMPAPDLPHGFLADDVTNHDVYYRVPYAHAFRSVDSTFDFVLINVHLYPNKGSRSKWKKRRKELSEILKWIYAHNAVEKDFILAGNMQIRTGKELVDVLPEGFATLNDELDRTKLSDNYFPYDHVFYRPVHTTEIDTTYDQREIPIIEALMPKWKGPGEYPGSPYNYKEFPEFYSDHCPIHFRFNLPKWDDDH
ncbi:MAG: hypothetical protein HQK83_11175 [Fibrobacteria bacterium]|nr:hypothetical protein [Fibrobacteria bacterium]